MTGDTAGERRRSETLFDLRHRSSSGKRMLDKEVQFNIDEMMDFEGADSGLGGSGDLGTTIVEINNSPTATTYEDPSVFNNNTPSALTETNVNEHEQNNSFIRRDSIEKLHELEDSDVTLCPDGTDSATLPVSFKVNKLLSNTKLENESADEIKEQSSLVVQSNSVSNEEKLKELSEKSDDSNCALDCLSFTLQCCDCTII